MVEISEIVDEDSLKAWLIERGNKQEAIWIASRAAARVLPWHLKISLAGSQTKSKLQCLSLFRRAVISFCYAEKPSVSVAKAAVFARDSTANADYSPSLTLVLAGSIGSAESAPESFAAGVQSAINAVHFGGVNLPKISWENVLHDCRVNYGTAHRKDQPLWAGSFNPFDLAWSEVKSEISKSPLRESSSWFFWIQWYDSLLEGKPMPLDLLEQIALIDPKIWEAGPGPVAEEIAKIEESYGRGKRIELFKATLFDFVLDETAYVMRAIPMPEDWVHLTDQDELNRFLKDALDLREDMAIFSQVLVAERAGSQGGAHQAAIYMGQILDELERAETINTLRVGKLVEWGGILENMALREDTRLEFGVTFDPFDRIVNKLKDLVRNHFAHTLARFSVLRDVRMEDGDDPWEVLKVLRSIILGARNGAGGVLPAMNGDDAAILEDIADSIDKRIRELDAAKHEETRLSLKREIDFQIAKVGATSGVYIDKAKGAAGLARKTGEGVDAALKWEKRGTGLMRMLREIWERYENLRGA